jgi:hypothetical protein
MVKILAPRHEFFRHFAGGFTQPNKLMPETVRVSLSTMSLTHNCWPYSFFIN